MSKSSHDIHSGKFEAAKKRKVFYKKGVLLDFIYHNCEISYDGNGFYITLFAVEQNSIGKTLHLPNNERTERIMKSFGYNFDKVAHSLEIRNGQLSIKYQENEDINFE